MKNEESDCYYLVRNIVHQFLTDRDLDCRVVHPLTGIPNKHRDEFWKSLDGETKHKLQIAITWYQGIIKT